MHSQSEEDRALIIKFESFDQFWMFTNMRTFCEQHRLPLPTRELAPSRAAWTRRRVQARHDSCRPWLSQLNQDTQSFKEDPHVPERAQSRLPAK